MFQFFVSINLFHKNIIHLQCLVSLIILLIKVWQSYTHELRPMMSLSSLIPKPETAQSALMRSSSLCYESVPISPFPKVYKFAVCKLGIEKWPLSLIYPGIREELSKRKGRVTRCPALWLQSSGIQIGAVSCTTHLSASTLVSSSTPNLGGTIRQRIVPDVPSTFTVSSVWPVSSTPNRSNSSPDCDQLTALPFSLS